jgi:hypothetical protein
MGYDILDVDVGGVGLAPEGQDRTDYLIAVECDRTRRRE